jgi:hypothetical protein
VALVHCGVGTQKIQIFFPFYVPNPDAFGPGDDHIQRMIIVGAVPVF